MYVYVNKELELELHNDLAPIRRQAITWIGVD